MWPVTSLRLLDWNGLAGRGVVVGLEEIWNRRDGGLSRAVVSVGGCSGVFISPEGLILTARRCVTQTAVTAVLHQGVAVRNTEVVYIPPEGAGAFALLRAPIGPERWLAITSDPAPVGEAVLVMGMPRRTERYLPAASLERDIGFVHPRRAEILSGWLEVLRASAARDVKTASLLVPEISRVQTQLERTQGRLEGLRRSGALARAREQDRRIREWIAASPRRRSRQARLLDELDSVVISNDATREKDILLRYMLAASRRVARALPSAPGVRLPEGEIDPITDRLVTEWFVARALRLPDSQRIAGLEAGMASEDSMTRLAMVIAPERDAWRRREQERNEAFAGLQPAWMKLLARVRPVRAYPDADGSLRLSVGARMQDASCHGSEGECFLTDADTAPGSAGGPVLNGRGDLVGIDLERVGGDAACEDAWSAEHSRNVVLEARSILAHLERTAATRSLLDEMRGR